MEEIVLLLVSLALEVEAEDLIITLEVPQEIQVDRVVVPVILNHTLLNRVDQEHPDKEIQEEAIQQQHQILIMLLEEVVPEHQVQTLRDQQLLAPVDQESHQVSMDQVYIMEEVAEEDHKEVEAQEEMVVLEAEGVELLIMDHLPDQEEVLH